MFKRLSLFFYPQEANNYRALLLHPSFIGLFIAVYLLNQSILQTIAFTRPGVLGYSSEITVQKVLEQTNKERQAAGLKPVRFNSVLSKSAENKAKDMFAHDYWAHNSPEGKNPWDFFHEAGYQYSVAGENLARDFYDTDSMMKAWMKSPTHKANIVNPKYQELGVGVVNGLLNGIKTTLVVQHFGTPQSGILGDDVTSEEIAINEIPAQTETAEAVTARPASKLVNPLAVSKTVGIALFVIIVSVLAVDAYYTYKNKTHRLVGSSAGHISFLAIIIMLLIFSRQGSIF